MNKDEFWAEGGFERDDMGEIVKLVREDQLGISQAELADNCGIKLTTLQQCEKGKGNQVAAVLKKVTEKAGLNVQISVSN